MADIAANLAGVQERVARAAERAARDPSAVELLVVSKPKPGGKTEKLLRYLGIRERVLQPKTRREGAAPGLELRLALEQPRTTRFQGRAIDFAIPRTLP